MKKLRNKVFRDTYLAEHVRTWIAYQVTALRHQRGLTQADLAELTGKQQSVISRIEDPDYGPVKLSVLLSIASALDIALAVKFVPFGEALAADLSAENMQVPSFDEEFAQDRLKGNIHFTSTSTNRSVQHKFMIDMNAPVIDISRFGTWARTSGTIVHFGGHGNFAPTIEKVIVNAPYSLDHLPGGLNTTSLRNSDPAGALIFASSAGSGAEEADRIAEEGTHGETSRVESI